jgi:histone demethylase JARID1
VLSENRFKKKFVKNNSFLSQHWKHLCECSPEKHRLLYHHTLAELGDLACEVKALSGENVKQSPFLLNDIPAPSKKV